jgi:hypothetical protein
VDIQVLPAILKKHRTMRIFLIFISIIFLTACKTNQLAVIKSNGKYGCINNHGKIIIEPIWDCILQGHKNKQILVEKDSLYGFIDKKGKIIIKPQYKDAKIFYEGLAAVGNGKKYGFINLKGDTVIPFIYDDIFLGFSNGLSDVTKNDSCGYIDKNGKVVIPLLYETCYPFESDLAHIETFDGKTLLVNKKGETLTYDKEKYKNKDLWGLNSYPGSFKTKTGQGRMNDKGDTIVPPIYDVTGNLLDHMYIIQLKGKWGAYNDKGKLVIEPKFDKIWHFNEGFANFQINGKWGFVNKKGQIVIKPSFDYASGFYNGLAYVEINSKVGFINKTGNFVIGPKFEVYRLTKFE